MSKSPRLPRPLRVFLCHSSGDKASVRALYQRLRADGVEPWLDEEDILPGQDWEYEIAKAVRAVDVVLVCLSRESVTKSGYVQKEIRFALDIADEQPEGSIFIIPLKLEECDVPDRLRRWHWVNHFEPHGYERLLRALRSLAAKVPEIDAFSPDGESHGSRHAGTSDADSTRRRTLHPESTNVTPPPSMSVGSPRPALPVPPQTRDTPHTPRAVKTKAGRAGRRAAVLGILLVSLLALIGWGVFQSGAVRRLLKGNVEDLADSGDGSQGSKPEHASGGVNAAAPAATGQQAAGHGTWVNELTLTGHAGEVNAVAFSLDGKTLASGSEDKTIKLWDAQTGALRKTLNGIGWEIRSLAFSGTMLASGSNHFTLKLWDAQTGTLKQTRSGHTGSILALKFSLDGTVLASASCDEKVKLWEFGNDSLSLKRTINAQRHNLCIGAVAISPDGSTVASAGSEIKLWDTQTGALKQTLTGHREGIADVAFSPDGQTLASAGCDKTIKFWDMRTGQLRQTLVDHDDCTMSVEFSPDGRMLASGSKDKTIKLWDAQTGALKQTLTGHEGVVWQVAFSPDGKMLASASGDKTVKVWKLEP